MSQNTINKINSMRSQGYTDSQIITSLQEQGLPPREINDSLSQINIKNELNVPAPLPNQEQYHDDNNPDLMGMQPSMINEDLNNLERQEQIQEDQDNSQTQNYQETQNYQDQYAQQFADQYAQQYQQQNNQYYGNQYQEPQYPVQEQYQEGQYPSYQEQYQEQYPGNQQPYYSQDPQMLSEIIDQLIEEKLSKLTYSLSSVAEFKIITEAKLEKLNERLERIEKIIDSIQTSVMRKTSESSDDLQDIKSEMQLMQESFSKVINPLIDKGREGENLIKNHPHKSRHKNSRHISHYHPSKKTKTRKVKHRKN